MAASVRFLVVLVLVLAVAVASSATSLGGGDHHLQLGILSTTGGVRGECRGTVGECLEEEEGELGSASGEAHRRMLAGKGYISYQALCRDSVPCSRHGASYYNCRPGASAKPYHRGCSRITRCRGRSPPL